MSTHTFDALPVLTLEDDAADFHLLSAAAERYGRGRVLLRRVTRLEDAFRYIESDEPVALILADLNVSDSEGIDTFRQLRRAAPDHPIVVLSGQNDEELALRVVQEGAQECLAKGDLGSQALVRCLVHSIERHRQQQELERARATALAASQAKTLFLANVSHEIRTPMNSILGMADLLMESGLRDDQVSYVEVFRRSGEALVEIVNGLLDLSRVEAGQLQLESALFPMWELIEGVGELLAFPAHRKGLSLSIDIGADVPAWVIGDAGRVRQILINLVGNAVKFTGCGEVVLVAQLAKLEGRPGPALQLMVRDSGAGIPNDRLEAIFDDFSQADPSTARQFGGTGLGLALSRRLAEAMDGTLTVTSDQAAGSSGSQFELLMPIEIGEAPAESAPLQPTGALAGRRVLVAEAGETERRLVCRYLERLGCEVTECKTSFEVTDAVKRMEESSAPFDALLLACRLPVHGALDWVRQTELGKRYAARTIALMPADRRPSDLQDASALGLGAWIERPIKPSALERALRSVILTEDLSDGSGTSYPVPTEAIHVLVADDSVDNRSLIQAYVKGSPIELTLAEDGREAYELFLQQPFDLVLMDVRMPIMNGHEATSAIRSWERGSGREPTPILALTAYAFAEDRARSADVGCNGHLVKPLRKATLFQAFADYTRKQPIDIAIDPDIEDLIPGYLDNRRQDVVDLRTAQGEADFETMQRLGHNMKGTGRGYGFDEITEIGATLEAAAKAERTDELTRLTEKLASFLSRVHVVFDQPDPDAKEE